MPVVTLQDATAKRAALRAAIWPTGGYPAERRANTVEAWSHAYWGQLPAYAALPLASLTRLHVNQLHGVNVRPLHFRPSTRRNRGLVFAIGHDAGPWYPMPRNVLYRFLAQGFDVISVAMPLYFMEDRPLVGNVQLGLEHGELAQFQTASFHPLAWFLEPSIAAVNRLLDAGCTDVSMLGYSGGGWCTTVLPALDTRIAHSYPVASGMPLDLRVGNEFGDWEQFGADIWQNTDYRDLHVMAADRPGRSQVQVFNQYDPIFPADAARIAQYAPTVQSRAAALGGSWGLYTDRLVNEHTISDLALNRVMSDLQLTIWQ